MNNIFIYFVGTAGSGKSTLTYAFQQWMNQQGYDAITVNLDPGVENLAYTPDIDIREWIVLSDIMREFDLGPNGAQVAAADMLAMKIPEVKSVIDTFKTDYILIDTPGQMELFTFRESSRYIIEYLEKTRSLIAFLFDPFLARTASGFISQILLSVTAQFRFTVPAVNVLSKIDMLKSEEIDLIEEWSENPYRLYDDAISEKTTMHTQLSVELFRVLEEMGVFRALIPLSSETRYGLEDLYNVIQQVFMGGEDLSSD